MAAPFLERQITSSPEYAQEDPLLTVVGIGVIVMLDKLSHEEAWREQLSESGLHILTAEELTSKAETDKAAGDITLFQETIKVDPVTLTPETPLQTLHGVTEELLDMKGYRDVGNHFHRVVFRERPEISLQSLPGFAGGIELVVYDGPPYAFKPAVDNEVAPAKWRSVDSYLGNKSARPASRELIEHAVTKNLLDFGLAQHREGKTTPLFPQGFQFDVYHRKRAELPDITKVMR